MRYEVESNLKDDWQRADAVALHAVAYAYAAAALSRRWPPPLPWGSQVCVLITHPPLLCSPTCDPVTKPSCDQTQPASSAPPPPILLTTFLPHPPHPPSLTTPPIQLDHFFPITLMLNTNCQLTLSPAFPSALSFAHPTAAPTDPHHFSPLPTHANPTGILSCCYPDSACVCCYTHARADRET